MDLQTAKKLVYEQVDMFNKIIDKTMESNSYFLFSLASIDENGNTQRLFIPPVGIHKTTGNLTYVNPLSLSREERASIGPVRKHLR